MGVHLFEFGDQLVSALRALVKELVRNIEGVLHGDIVAEGDMDVFCGIIFVGSEV